MERRAKQLYAAGILLLVYAVLGNYVALPGYMRSLERGGRSEAGSSFDAAVVLGAAKTVLWMYSFQLGVLATWEVCGLGSTGRMLHPDQAARPLAQNILVTQSSKLMFEFLFAWSLLLASALTSRRVTSS